MAMQIDETIQVDAPPERVWRFLIDPRQVVHCLPGAELLEEQDERTYAGRVRVKVGPVVAAYAGTARLVQVDEAAHTVRIEAEGREHSGTGSARMTMTSTVTPRDGGSEVQVHAELDLAGRIVQFGRGMIDTVNRQLFRQFAACVQSTLALPVEPAEPTPSAHDAATDASAMPLHTASRPGAPVRILPLLFSALRDMLARLLPRRRRP